MTKLYAIRDKETGKLQCIPRIDAYAAPLSQIAHAYPGGCYPNNLELVPFRIEPIKPCLYCYNSSTESKFCHICGRSLK